MARPNLKKQRRAQILDAAMQCVAQYGVSGLTLEKVAEVANLARPLIRHNIGNREQLIDAVTQQYLQNSRAQMNDLYSQLPSQTPFTKMIDYLFDHRNSDKSLMLVAEALIAESSNNEHVAELMRGWLSDFVERLEQVAGQEFPDAAADKINTVVTGVTGIYFTVESLSPLAKFDEFSSSSKKAALLLLDQI